MTPRDFLSKEQVSGPALQVQILDLKRHDSHPHIVGTRLKRVAPFVVSYARHHP